MTQTRLWSCARKFRGALPAILGLVFASAAGAQVPPIALEPIVANLAEPVLLTHSGDGTHRRFILEQSGRILVLQPDAASPSVFLDIRGRVLAGGEQGMLGLAFHPEYASNRRFFVNYTRRPDGATVIAEFRATVFNSNAGDAASEAVLLVIEQPFANHNGGMIEFGPDNLLYIGVGDGGSGNDPQNRAQNLNELLGKILRIDVDNPQGQVLYSSPPSNPFFGSAPGRDEIYAYGFRNPWRFSFDRLTSDLVAGDVGQGAREEIDNVVRGGNYGWRVFEGTRCTGLDPSLCFSPGFIPPVTEYNNGEAGRCSVTGGYVYRGTRESLPSGAYVFADFCSGEIFMLHNGVQTLLVDTTINISSFGEDESGEIYVVGLGGSIHRITSPGPRDADLIFFDIPARGGMVLSRSAEGLELETGYARIQTSGRVLPAGLAHFFFRRDGVVVSEALVPSSPLLQSGRVFATTGQSAATGIAIVNPGTADVRLDFHFTAASGQRFGDGSLIILAGSKITAFLHESPFNGPSAFTGSFTFRATSPVAAMALIGRLNGRSDFLMTPLPVVNLGAVPPRAGAFPHWVHGGAWNTEFVLVNTSRRSSTGRIDIVLSSGRVVESILYALPSEATRVFTPGIFTSTARTGSAQITPFAGSPPQGIALLRHTVDGMVLTEAGVTATVPGQAFEIYGEMAAGVRTGLVVANVSPRSVTATISLTHLDGTSGGQGMVELPPFGQGVFFLNEIPGLASAGPFQGSVRISAPTQVAVASLRERINERGESVLAASPPGTLTATSASLELLFPHWALGDGYDMQFILMNPGPGDHPGVSGALFFLNNSGQSLPLLLP